MGVLAQELMAAPVEVWWAKLLVIALAYAVTLGLGSSVVMFFVSPPQEEEEPERGQPGPDRRRRFDAGWLIGRCENVITVTFVLAGEATGLALIFAAKSIVRREAIERDASYYLGGTLVNLVWGLMVASVARVLVFGL